MRLNLGCGGAVAPDWLNIDRAGEVDLIHDLTEPLPVADDSVDGAVAHHLIDLLPFAAVLDLLAEVRRVLTLGAVLRISCADIECAVAQALVRDEEWFPEPKASFEETVGWFITQGGARRTFVNVDRLKQWCEHVGFAHTFTSDYGRTMGPVWMTDLDDRIGESFWLEAIR